MKTCPNCGHQMSDETRYCTACGAMCPDDAPQPVPAESAGPVQEPVAPQPPQDWAPSTPPVPPQGGGKKSLIIGAASVAAVACIGVGIFMAMNHGGGEPKLPDDPAGQFKAIQTGYINSMFSALDELPVNTAPEAISTDLTIMAQYDDNGEISSYLDGSSIGLQLDGTQNSALIGMDFTFKNTPIVSGTLTYEDGLLGLCVPELADSWYTMDLERLMEQYSDGLSLDLDTLMTPRQFSFDTFKQALNNYLSVLLSVVTEENIAVEENASFTLDLSGKSLTGTVYTVTPAAKDIEAMLLALADQLENDTFFMTIMKDYYGAAMLEIMDQSARQYGELTTEEQLKQSFKEAADDIRKNAKTVAAQVEAEHLTWTLSTDGKKAGKQVIAGDSFLFSREASEDGVAARITAMGEEVLNLSVTTEDLYLFLGADGEEITVSGEFAEKGGLYSGQVSASFSTDTFLSIKYQDMDPKKTSALNMPYGSYDFAVWDNYTNISFHYDVQAADNGGTDHILRFSIPEAASAEFDPDKLTVVINSTDKASTITAPTSPQVDITNYTPEQFEALGNELSTAATGLLFKLMMALYS